MNLHEELKSLVQKLDDENEAAFNLWSWLPSEHFAKKAHGDYACEFRGTNEEVMKEVCVLLSYLAGYKLSDESLYLFRCGCEDCEFHNPLKTREEIIAVIESKFSRKKQELKKEPKKPSKPPADIPLADLPGFGEHMKIEDWLEECEKGSFVNSDGKGALATVDKISHIVIWPSDAKIIRDNRSDPDVDYSCWTHVVWFNK